MKTKTLATVCALSLAGLTLAATVGTEVYQDAIRRILTLKAKDLLTAGQIDTIIRSTASSYTQYRRITFRDGYYLAREKTHEVTLSQWQSGDNESERAFLKGLLIATLKEQLHKPNVMREIYGECREGFKKSMAAQVPEFRKAVNESVASAIDSFTNIKDAGYRQGLENWILEDEGGKTGAKMQELLEKNTSPEDLIKLPEASSASFRTIVKAPKDIDIAKFALRRFKEGEMRQKGGGNELVNQYIDVLRWMQDDINDAAHK